MNKDPIALFSVITAIGLSVMILGFRLVPNTRKTVETAGAIVFHIGVLGILYYKVALFLFLSLAALVLSLFLLFDPLKISQYVNERYYRLLGYFFLALAVIFSLAHITGFPPGLWTIPLLVYLLPYLVPSLKQNLKLILTLAWLIIFAYLGIIGYIIYGRYYPVHNEFIDAIIHPKEPTEPIEPDDVEDLKLPPNPTVKTIDPQTPISSNQSTNQNLTTGFEQVTSKPQPVPTPAVPATPVAPQPAVPVVVNAPVNTPAPAIVSTPVETPKEEDELTKLKREYETLKHLYEQLAAENKELKDRLKTE